MSATFEDPATVDALARGNLIFGLHLFRHFSQSTPEQNIVVSPFMAAAALLALLDGATGATAAEIKEVLRVTSVRDVPSLRNAMKELMASIAVEAPGKFQMAHNIFDKDGVLKDEYKEAMQDFCALVFVPSSGDLDEDRNVINSSIANETNEDITEIVSEDDVNDSSRIVLLTALIFRGVWMYKFPVDSTRQSWFYSHGGTRKAQIPTMRRRGMFRFGIVDRPPVRVLELPYEGRDLSLIIVLPKDVDGLPAIEGRFNADTVRLLYNSMMESKISVVLPCFEISGSYSLVDPMKTMGASAAFTEGKANLGNMADEGHVTSFRQEVVFEINEGGENDAPAMVSGKKVEAAADVEEYFVADHPFLFFVTTRHSHMLLLVGRFHHPS